MLFSLTLPALTRQMRSGVIIQLDATEGCPLSVGSRLLDVRVDLSAVAAQDCPPIYFFRLVARERGWVRKVCARVGEERGVGDLLALISTDPEESLDGPPARALRIASASVVPEFQWRPAGRER